ncbi:hypothetical protein [Hafnia paralvei]|uniref:hypothetical protein n=1 Tax=Hafnia paralvei TaxID=546367 RepID=UPI003C2F142C
MELTKRYPFTREQLIERAQDAIAAITEDLQLNMSNEAHELFRKSLAVAEIALAALEAEPVGYINIHTGVFHKPEWMVGDDLDRALYFPVFGTYPLLGGIDNDR